MSQTRNALVLYHANCTDGFGSAWAFHRLVEKNYAKTEYHAMKYEEDVFEKIPQSTWESNIDVLILDFSFSRQVITQLCELASQVVVLDHHKTAAEILKDWPDAPSNSLIRFDMNRSGAGMSWDFFSLNGHQDRPALINYIEDRDLWRFKLWSSKEISAVILNTPFEFDEFTSLDISLQNNPSQIIVAGRELLKQNQRHVKKIIESSKREITFFEHKGLICNCPGHFASDVGNDLVEESGTFGACYYYASNGHIHVSLRSKDSSPVDVSEIAKKFGGGGHRNAAGFVLADPEFKERWIK